MRHFNFPKISTGLLIVLVTFLLNMAAETTAVFVPLYGQSLGASALQVGAIVSVNAIAFFVSSLISGRQSDIHGRLIFVRIGLGLLVVAYILHIFVREAGTLLLIRGVQGLCMGVVTAAFTAYTYEYQQQIGRYISFGSLGVLFGDFTAAIVRDYHSLFIASAVISLIGFVLALRLVESKQNRAASVTLPLSLLKADGRAYLSVFIRQIGAAGVFTIFPLLMISLGASRTWVAALNAINMISQFIAMRYVEKINPVVSFRLGLILSAVVFTAYGTLTHYQFFIPAMLLIGVGWSLLYIGVLVYLLRRNPERGSVSGLLFSTQYVAWGIGSFVGGGIAQVLGFSSVMLTGAGLALIAALTSRGLKADDKKIKPTKPDSFA